jgi:hypothetical protein
VLGFVKTLTMETALIKAVVVARVKVKVAKVEQEFISVGQARVYSMYDLWRPNLALRNWSRSSRREDA